MRTRAFWIVVLVFLAGDFHRVEAQVDRATLEGTVMDPAGASIAGAKVTITAVSTSESSGPHHERARVLSFPRDRGWSIYGGSLTRRVHDEAHRGCRVAGRRDAHA